MQQSIKETTQGSAAKGKGLFERAHSEKVPQQHTQVVSQCRGLLPLGQLFAPAQSRASQSTVIEHMSKTAFEMFAPLAQQRFAALAARRPAGSA